MADKLDPEMRALKLLVIALGLALVAGLGVLGTAIVWRIHRAPGPPATAARSRIVLPAGAQIVSAETADGRLVVRSNLPDGGTRLDIFDLATGAPVATIELAPALKQ
jgi:Family of unknown function (DUF6476)